MRLQFRFLLMMAVVCAVVSVSLFFQQQFEITRSKSILTSELKQRKAYFASFVGLDGRSEQTFSVDYSFWDDFVNFVKTDNLTFAHENLDIGLGTFNVDADWVFRPNGTQIYFSSADGSNKLRSLSLPQAFFKKLSQEKFAHFYIKINSAIVEIRSATIVPSNDPYHKSAAQGYFLVGRVLNQSYLGTIAKLSNSNVKLVNGPSLGDQTTTNTVSFSDPLQNWSGGTIAALRSTSTVQVVQDLKHQYSREILLILFFTAAEIILIAIMLWWLVLRPVGLVITAIKQQKPELLKTLGAQKTEFGRLAETVISFFQQKISLAEAEFKRSELEKLNKEKSSFLAVAAHELNSPVANVKLFAEYLAFLLKGNEDRTKIDQQVHRIEHQSTKINMLLNDLRAASVGKGSLEFKLQDFDFDAFLKEEVAEAAFSSKHKLNVSCDTKTVVRSDPDRLGQVVTNLIRNANKYTPGATGTISIDGTVQDNKIVVSVQDFGMGISAADMPHIFERFYRADSVSSSIPGLGLGLYISKSIIEALGGSMWVTSEQQRGSTFYFTIPIKQATASSTVSETAHPIPPSTPPNNVTTPPTAQT